MGEPFDIICFNDQWDKYRRRDKSIMLELAKRDEIDTILFVELPLTLTSLIKFLLGRTAQFTAERWARLRSKGQIFQEGKVFVATPVCLLPFDRFEPLQEINIRLMNLQRRRLVERFLKAHPMKNVVLWVNQPRFEAGFVGEFNERLLCYDLCDDHTEFRNTSARFKGRLEQEDAKLTAAADLIFVASRDLERKKRALKESVWRIPNAIDFDYFRGVFASASEPDDLAALGRPRLGYVGKITYRTDLGLVEHAARAHPEWNVVLIGPVSPGTEGVERLRELRNVAFLGEKSYDEVPAYLKYVDVCIMPHKRTGLTTSQDPLKLYGYLASGKPIVSTDVAGVDAFADVVRISVSKESFVAQIEAALRESDGERAAKQLALAQENSWSSRADVMFKLIQEKLAGRDPHACEAAA
ncbi:MAG: glycosyltransferase [Chloroflexi bacterium]|nr:glycosyltransferase [Chloroflexota bacterium]